MKLTTEKEVIIKKGPTRNWSCRKSCYECLIKDSKCINKFTILNPFIPEDVINCYDDEMREGRTVRISGKDAKENDHNCWVHPSDLDEVKITNWKERINNG